MHHGIIDSILGEEAIGDSKKASEICLVVCEQHVGSAFAVQLVAVEASLHGEQSCLPSGLRRDTDLRRNLLPHPRPGITKPERRQHVNRGRIASAVGDGNADGDIVDIFFGVLHLYVEIPVFLKNSCIEQLELRVAAGCACHSPRPIGCKEKLAADTCTETSYTSA